MMDEQALRKGEREGEGKGPGQRERAPPSCARSPALGSVCCRAWAEERPRLTHRLARGGSGAESLTSWCPHPPPRRDAAEGRRGAERLDRRKPSWATSAVCLVGGFGHHPPLPLVFFPGLARWLLPPAALCFLFLFLFLLSSCESNLGAMGRQSGEFFIFCFLCFLLAKSRLQDKQWREKSLT